MLKQLMAVGSGTMLLLAATLSVSADDLRDGVPPDVYLATYHRANPERDYMKEYFAEIWDTVESTKLIDKISKIIERHADEDDLEKLTDAKETLMQALEPIDWDALKNCSESVYAQKMVIGPIPTSQHLLMLRLPDSGASGLAEAITNLFNLAEEASNGEVSVVSEEEDGVQTTVLELPQPVPFQPCVAVMDDLFVFSTKRELLEEGLALLKDPSAESKFDDERIEMAMSHLPEMEDGITFFDGQALFTQLDQLPEFIRNVKANDEHAKVAANFVGAVLDQFDGFDFEVTVEYTDGYQLRSASFGKLLEGVDELVIGKMLVSQEVFEEWNTWVPASATSYSLNSGVNLHELYAWLMDAIPEYFPEAQDGLDQFAQVQEQNDLYLDEDFLQSFTGECISVSLPGSTQSQLGEMAESVTLLKCTNPDRIQELLHRLVDTVNNRVPQARQQGLELVESEDLEGFEQLNVKTLASMGLHPVIGFQDGWMIIGTSAESVQLVLDTRAGEGDTIVGTDTFTQFDLDVEGAVRKISYANLAEATRGIAAAITQAGFMAPLMLMSAPQNEELQVVRDVVSLIPSIGKIIAKFDFLESKLSVVQPGEEDLTYSRNTVILVRPLDDDDDSSDADDDDDSDDSDDE